MSNTKHPKLPRKRVRVGIKLHPNGRMPTAKEKYMRVPSRSRRYGKAIVNWAGKTYDMHFNKWGIPREPWMQNRLASNLIAAEPANYTTGDKPSCLDKLPIYGPAFIQTGWEWFHYFYVEELDSDVNQKVMDSEWDGFYLVLGSENKLYECEVMARTEADIIFLKCLPS